MLNQIKMKKYLYIFIAITSILVSCNNKTENASSKVEYQCPMKCENDKVYSTNVTCPICKMDLKPIASSKKVLADDFISENSIFNLTTKWNTQNAKTIELKELKGKTLVMVMVYTTCKAACPRLVADMRNIAKEIPEKLDDKVQYVFVSIDPENDTPTRLKQFAKENYMDTDNYTFLQGTESGVREFANVLAVKYKEISPLDFSHSNIISVFNPMGELVHQQEGLGVDNKETIAKILETADK